MNIIEYVEKKGIYTFEEKPFCEVDSLVISQLSYLKFLGILPGPAVNNAGIILSDILDNENYNLLYRDERYEEINGKFFTALCNSRRFGHLLLNNFIDIIDDNLDIQFSAMSVSDSCGFNYIVFRGTDDSVVGWKEDLNMTFKIPVPAQKYSVDYLKKVAGNISGKFYVGGHSKGGNLAVYSSMNTEKEIRDRIIRIFSHDGPGFRAELIRESHYDEIKDRIVKFVPKSAVVGLFGNLEAFEVVDCEKRGVKQHNPYNWIIDGFEFKRAEHVSKYSLLKAEAINSWACEMTKEQWEVLSDSLFGALEEAGITNLNDFNDDIIKTLSKLKVAADSVDSDNIDKIKSMLALFRECAKAVAKEDANEHVMHAEKVIMQTINDKTKGSIKNKIKRKETNAE